MRIGIIGFGFMGRMHMGVWSRMPGVRVVAVCDADPAAFGSVDSCRGNIAGLPDSIDWSGIRFFTSPETLLQDASLDAVSVTLPTYLHADIVCRLLRAGVHVLCEKPMALNVPECRRMMAASDESGRKLMIAHCIRFWPAYAHTRRVIQSGQYGRVHAARFGRYGAVPGWSSGGWLIRDDRSGGMMLDLHIHDADYIQSLFGMPRAVASRGLNVQGSTRYVQTEYLYHPQMNICAEAGWLASDSFGFRMNYEIWAENAVFVFDSTRQPAYRIFPAGGEAFSPSISDKDGYFHEIEYFIDWISGQVREQQITMQQSLDSVRLIEAEKQSVGCWPEYTVIPLDA
ncbi:MAG: Gfo/Idh/MocA family oxidoreductase [Planctomycetales bacterium]|nr:Gfo/Idh/MocA family oxidoreductase [Planctomycetales bacterium]